MPASLEEMVLADGATPDPTPGAGAGTEASSTPDDTAGEITAADDTQVADAATEGEGTDSTEGEVASEPDDDQVSIREYAKSVLEAAKRGTDWVTKYADDDAFILGLGELQAKLGQRDESGQIAQYLKDNGVSIDDIQALIQERSGKASPEKSNGKADEKTGLGEDLSQYVFVDGDGNVVPKAGAPPDIADRVARQRVLMSEAMLSPAKFADLLKPYLSKDFEGAAAATKQEVEQRLAADANQREFDAWIASKASDLYTGEVGKSDFTAAGALVSAMLAEDDFYPRTPPAKRAEKAMKIANSELGHKPTSKTLIPATARRQTTPATPPPKKLSVDEFAQKYPDYSLIELDEFKEEGKLPDRAPKKT